MVKAIGRHFQGAVWERCSVHFVRNALSLCGVTQRRLVLSLMHSVTDATTRALKHCRKSMFIEQEAFDP